MTYDELIDALEEDFIWRRREILSLSNLLVKSSDEDEKRALMRSCLAILYAHWEGFIKSASQNYLYFVRDNAPNFSALKENFLWVMTKNETDLFYGTKLPVNEQANIIGRIIEKFGALDPSSFDSKIDTESNLKEKVFLKICSIIGLNIDYAKYPLKILCEDLLGRRNKVAHGSNVEASYAKVIEYRESVLNSMNEFMYDIMQLAESANHLKEAA